jgi:hypothetical protein
MRKSLHFSFPHEKRVAHTDNPPPLEGPGMNFENWGAEVFLRTALG